MSTYHFIAGLPRSGSTLLSTILNQNPRFEACISSPLARFVRAVVDQSSAQGGYRHMCPEDKRKAIIHGIFKNYYNNPDKEVFFNTNRGWPLLLPMVKDLYPASKVILCVRDIPSILNSFEKLVRKNPYTKNNIFPDEYNINVYTRCSYLMDQSSTLGFAYMAIKHCLTSDERNMLFILEYENLCKQPEQMIKALYNFIGEEPFEHDFNNVEASYSEFDNDVQIAGMHTTRKKVEWVDQQLIIPPDIIAQYSNLEVWR